MMARIPGSLWALTQLLRMRALHRLRFTFGWVAKRPIEPTVVDSYLLPSRQDAAVRRDLRRFLRGVDRRHTLLAASQLPAARLHQAGTAGLGARRPAVPDHVGAPPGRTAASGNAGAGRGLVHIHTGGSATGAQSPHRGLCPHTSSDTAEINSDAAGRNGHRSTTATPASETRQASGR